MIMVNLQMAVLSCSDHSDYVVFKMYIIFCCIAVKLYCMAKSLYGMRVLGL